MKPIVIIADDDAELRNLLIRVLEQSGYRAITAADGFQALLQVGATSPVAVIVDVSLPGISGVRLAEVLKSQEQSRGIPIVGISGFDVSQDELQVFDAFLGKPFRPAELTAVLARLAPVPPSE